MAPIRKRLGTLSTGGYAVYSVTESDANEELKNLYSEITVLTNLVKKKWKRIDEIKRQLEVAKEVRRERRKSRQFTKALLLGEDSDDEVDELLRKSASEHLKEMY